MLQTLKDKLHLTPRNCITIVSLTLIFKGDLLLKDRAYFFYPPKYESLMNSNIIDMGIILIGVLLLALILVPIPRGVIKKINLFGRHTEFDAGAVYVNTLKALLVISAFIMLTLALLQITHGIFTPRYRMGHSALGDMFIFAIIALTASDV